MKKELVDLQPKLEQAKIDNTKIMKVRNSNIYHTVSVFKVFICSFCTAKCIIYSLSVVLIVVFQVF